MTRSSNNNEDSSGAKYMELSNADADIDEDDDEEFIDESDDDNNDDDNDDDDEVHSENEDVDEDGDDRNMNGNHNDQRQIAPQKSQAQKKGVILQGFLHLNEEERYVYSGTWTTQGDLKECTEGERHEPMEPRQEKENEGAKNGHGGDANKNKDKKKKRKFKLKSKMQLKDESSVTSANGSSSDATATVTNLLTIVDRDGDGDGYGEGNETIDKPQSILFDGFFVTDETDKIQPHRRVKERDVEITFSQILDTPTRASTSKNGAPSSKRRYRVEGKGANEFGAFLIEGTYTPQRHPLNGTEKNGQGPAVSVSQSLTCHKWYTPIVRHSKRRWGTAAKDEDYGDGSDDDYEISGDEKADFEEIIGLQNEAGMSIEELRKMYYGGGETTGGDDGINEPLSKRCKLMDDDDDDDDGCGF